MSNDYTKQVVGRTVKARKDAGFASQSDIAKALGISRDRYARYETERIIHKEFITRFCEVTGITEGWLLSGEPSTSPPVLDEFTQLMSKIEDPDIRAELIKYALRLVLEKKHP